MLAIIANKKMVVLAFLLKGSTLKFMEIFLSSLLRYGILPEFQILEEKIALSSLTSMKAKLGDLLGTVLVS
jgi:hypothetical protein